MRRALACVHGTRAATCDCSESVEKPGEQVEHVHDMRVTFRIERRREATVCGKRDESCGQMVTLLEEL